MNENVVIQKEKNGVKAGVVVFLCILFSAIFGVGGWFLGTKLANVEDEKHENVKVEENTVDVIVPEKNSAYTFVKEVKDTLTFGDKSADIVSYYYIDKESVSDMDPEGEKFDVYILRRDVFVKGKLIDKTYILGDYPTHEEANAAISNYGVIKKGVLKDSKNANVYNLVELAANDTVKDGIKSFIASDYKRVHIVTIDGIVLKTMSSKLMGTSVIGVFADSSMLKDKHYVNVEKDPERDYPVGKDYYLYPNDRLVDLHDNFLYYFTYSPTPEECGYVDYRLTIEDGKIVENIDTDFDIDLFDAAGQTC